MTDFVVGNLLEPAVALTASDVPAAFPSLDAALQDALSANRSAAVRCDLLQGGPASSFAIHEFIPTRLGPVIEFRAADGLGQAVLVLKDSTGPCVYAAAKIGGGTRWVALSGLTAFYALAKVDRDSQRQGWIAKLKAVKKADWPSELVPARDRLGELSSAALRLLLAWLGPRGSIPIKGINQPAKKFRGAKTDGATLPVFRYPLVEPECYLRVISGHEGWVESINAYDLGAGISVGPIQFNAQGGFIIKLLRDLDVADPVLFADCFSSLEWTTEQGAAHPVLVVGGGPSPIRLVGRKQDNDRNIGYFHCGVPGKTAFADIDAAFRKDLTGRFRDAMVWPHVQELILATSAAWLQPGLDKLATAGFAAIDTKRPDRDLFVLKALLLSCFVRFSASLAPLIKHLKPFDTPREKLDALRPVLLAPGEWSELNRDRRTALADRMKAQRPVAEAVWDTIMRLADGTAAPEMASAAVPPAELMRENARLRELLRGLSLPTGGREGVPLDAALTTSPAGMPQTGRELIVLMPRAPAAAAAASPAAVTGPGRSTVPLNSQVASVLSARGASLNLLFDATAHAALDARAAAAPAAARSASLAYHRVLAKDADLDSLAEDLRALDSRHGRLRQAPHRARTAQHDGPQDARSSCASHTRLHADARLPQCGARRHRRTLCLDPIGRQGRGSSDHRRRGRLASQT